MLIGFTGRKGAGKDTAASFLIEQGYARIAFADKLKEAVANLLDMPTQEVDSFKNDGWLTIRRPGTYPETMDGREFLQRFGTEMGRNTFGQNFWIDQWQDTYTALSVMEPDKFHTGVVVTDVRFTNEALAIHQAGGYIIDIARSGYEPDGHASEEPLPSNIIDAYILNDGSLEDLREKVFATIYGLEIGVVG